MGCFPAVCLLAATSVAEVTTNETVSAAATNETVSAVATNETVSAAATDDAPISSAAVRTGRANISTRIFKLNHVSALEVAEKFNSMWSGEFGQVWKVTKMAVAFEESNSVMITAPAVILDACEKAIRSLDIEARQVYIEARFVELGNTASHKVGIDWSMLGGMTGTATLGGGTQQYNVGNGVRNYTRTTSSKSDGTTAYSLSGADTFDTNGNRLRGGGNGTISYFNGTLNFSQMSLTLKALDSTEDAKTFSNPKIIVSSGKKATVDMTTKYPNVKVSAKRSDSGGNATSLDIASEMSPIPGEDKMMFAKESFFSWGISLEVTPRIGTNGLINVSIVPTISSQEDWVETGAGDGDGAIASKYPVIKVQRLISEFNLASGTTAVIGGLSVTEEHQVDNGIPVLRSIPWIGPRLFGSMERVKEQKEIVVFVTVGLVDPRQMPEDAGLPKNAVLGRQYTKGQKLEPGDRPEKNMEGFDSLDMRLLEEQAKDPLKEQKKEGFSFRNYLPFVKDPEYKR